MARSRVLLIINRAKYIAAMWRSSSLPYPPNQYPEHMGWLMEKETFRLKWFEGEAFPSAMNVVCDETSDGNEYENDDDESSDGGSI